VVKIRDLNSNIFLSTTDSSQKFNRINQSISSESRNPTSTEPNRAVLSKSSSSNKTTTQNTKSFEVGYELENVTKHILVIDDDLDSAITIRSCLESYFKKDAHGSQFQAMEVTMYSNPVTALVEFKPYYYDLVLVDINMPTVNGYELVEKIIKLDLNIKVCFMSSGELNYEAIREIHHPVKSFGCFIRKPATRDYLIKRVIDELY
jgi:CheY-like chemotaxis protein